MKGSDFRIQQIQLNSSATELMYERNFEADEFEHLVSVNVPENMVYSNDFDTGLDIHYYYHGCSTMEITSFSLNDYTARSRSFKTPIYLCSFMERFKTWMESNDAIQYFKPDIWDWTFRRRNKQEAAYKL